MTGETTVRTAVRIHGRGAQREALRALLEELPTRGGQLLVTGEPGLGRTTLLQWAARSFRAGPVLRPRPGPDPGAHVTPERLLGSLRAAAGAAPVLVCVDDAHLWDAASRTALGRAAQGRPHSAGPVGLLLSVAADRAVDPEFAHLPVLRLDPLAPPRAAALLDDVTDGAVAPAVRERLLAEAEGNPALLLALVRRLSPGELRGHRPLPQPLADAATLAEVAGGAPAGPSAYARDLLLTVAAAVRGSDGPDVDAGPVLDAVRRLRPAPGSGPRAEALPVQLLLAGDRFRFHSPLVRRTVHATAAPDRRRAAHRALADVLESGGHRLPGLLHRSWSLSGPAPASSADRLASVAADGTVRASYRLRATAYARAAELTSDGAGRAERYTAAAEQALLAGRPERARPLLAAARGCAAPAAVRGRAELVRGLVELRDGPVGDAHQSLLLAASLLAADAPADAATAALAAADAAWAAGDLPACLATLAPGPPTRSGTAVCEGPGGAVVCEGPAGTLVREGPAGAVVCEGAAGSWGCEGLAGAVACEGLAGSRGCEGSAGAVVCEGAAGSWGCEGLAGAVACEGLAGSRGCEGSAGAVVCEGAAGSWGCEGLAGAVACEGLAGSRGCEGSAGAVVCEGAAGSRGCEGPAGAVVRDGGAGSRGCEGLAGAVVRDGAAWIPVHESPAGVPVHGHTVGHRPAVPLATVVRDHRVGMRALLEGRLDRAGGPLGQVVERGRTEERPEALLRSAAAALLLGDVDAARRGGARALAAARQLGSDALVPQALEYLAYAELRAGRHAQARTHAEEGLRTALSAGQRNTAANHRAVLALAASIEEEPDVVARHVAAALATARQHGLAQAATLAEWAAARADLGRGRPFDAADRLGLLVLPGPGRGHFAVWRLAVPCFVEAAVLAGRHDDTREVLTDFAGWAAFGADPQAAAQLARCHALLAPPDRADDLYRRALARHDEAGGDFERARTALLYGKWLRRRRRPREARGRLGTALAGFERCGAGVWAAQARDELRALGAAAPYGTGAGTLTRLTRLTPQQLRIARHVAEGATNREVALRLAVSTRTVDYHLRKVFAALGVRSRLELARLVGQAEQAEHVEKTGAQP
ncbi:LuxR C-terminal-related transcriptional regulator [Streptomyces sp. BBFR51]|uniref:LuxR C-terminal-related transcriptional regulator n=1 Tax=Streptomyces sp. BBFR51 TaxID=3372856 RepID=UPI0037DD97FE